MPQVPYSPIPTAQPQALGESVSINTPGAAFGENIGAAISKLGSTVGEVGNELWTRAVALEQLNQENIARDRQVKTAEQLTELHTNFMNLRGKEAADGLPGYLQQQKEIQKNNAQGLSLFANQKYQSDSLPFLQRNMFTAGAHAGDELKRYTVDSVNAQGDMALKKIDNDPANAPASIQELVANRVHAAAIKEGTHDPNSPILKDVAMNARSEGWTTAAIGLSKTDPTAAMSLIAQHRKDLTEKDYISVQNMLEGKATTIAADNIARKYIVDHTDPTTGQLNVSNAQAEKDLAGIADKTEGATPLLKSGVISHYAGLQFQNRIAQQRDEQEGKKWVNDAIVQNNITSDRQLRALPGADGQLQKAGPQIADRLQDYINEVSYSKHRVTSEISLARLKGLRNDNGAEFMNVNPYDPALQLNDKDAATVRQWQHQDSKTPYSDPRVMRTMGWLRGAIGVQLDAANINTEKANADTYHQYLGTLQEALQEFGENNNGKSPTYEQAIAIGQQVLNTQVPIHHWWRSDTSEPAFTHFAVPSIESVPPDFLKGFMQENPSATDDIVMRNYNRYLFNELYKGAKGGGATAARPGTAKPGSQQSGGNQIPD